MLNFVEYLVIKLSINSSVLIFIQFLSVHPFAHCVVVLYLNGNVSTHGR